MILKKILHNLLHQHERSAFVIQGKTYSYKFLGERISAIIEELSKKNVQSNDIVVIYTADDINTYACIIASMFIGATFVPINPLHPVRRNEKILSQILPKIIFSTVEIELEYINPDNLIFSSSKLFLRDNLRNIAYILFTSGTTGVPKGVIVKHENLDFFISDFAKTFGNLDLNDKFLQIYDLTFDASISCYLLSMYVGGTCYTVSPGKIKYIEAYKLLDKHKITFAKFPASILGLLKPYFEKIRLNSLKYCLFGGEPLQNNLLKLWQKSIPNAKIFNVYGPTEATVNTHFYPVDYKKNEPKNYNGIIAIGKPFGKNLSVVIDDEDNIVGRNIKGQLCIGGKQVAFGYLNDNFNTKASFFTYKKQRFYKTGDIVFLDNQDDYIFIGRKDKQVQIQGYRVELSEIEKSAFESEQAENYAVVALLNKFNIYDIFLFTQNLKNEDTLKNRLLATLPNYMLPSKIINLKLFPFLLNGKIDILKLKEIAKNEHL